MRGRTRFLRLQESPSGPRFPYTGTSTPGTQSAVCQAYTPICTTSFLLCSYKPLLSCFYLAPTRAKSTDTEREAGSGSYGLFFKYLLTAALLWKFFFKKICP